MPTLASRGLSSIVAGGQWFAGIVQGSNLMVSWGKICYRGDTPMPSPPPAALAGAAAINSAMVVCVPGDKACAQWSTWQQCVL